MKIDLTHLPHEDRVVLVAGYIAKKLGSGAAHKRPIYASDLLNQFKIRNGNITTKVERIAFFSRYLSAALETINKAREAAAAAPAAL